MDTITLIRRYTASLPAGKPFATKELLPYGLRNTIDSCLSRLVRSGYLTRLSRGIFVITYKLTEKNFPTAQVVAVTKAKAFGKQLFLHGADAAKNLALFDKDSTESTFATFGKSSSFEFLNTRIYLNGIAQSQSHFGDSLCGQIIRGIIYMAKEFTDRKGAGIENTKEMLSKIMGNLNRIERIDLCLAAQGMPAWLSDQLFKITRQRNNNGAKILWEYRLRQKQLGFGQLNCEPC